MTNREAVRAYKERSPNYVREEDARRKREKRIREREAKGIDFLPGHLAKRLAPIWGTADIERWYEYAKEREAVVIMRKTDLPRISRLELVPNEPFRLVFEKAYDKAALTSAVADELAKMEERDNRDYKAIMFKKDESKLPDQLGVHKRHNKNGFSVAIFCSYSLAEACCKAMGLTPHECGI